MGPGTRAGEDLETMADDCAPYVTQDGYDSGLIVLCADAGHNTPILTESWRGNGVNVHQTYQLPLDDAAAVAELHRRNPMWTQINLDDIRNGTV